MTKWREYWILEGIDGGAHPFDSQRGALVASASLGGEIIHVREVVEEPFVYKDPMDVFADMLEANKHPHERKSRTEKP